MIIRYCVLIALLLSIHSCTVEKRLYRKGWNISLNQHWKHDRPERAAKEVAETVNEEPPVASLAEASVAQTNDTLSVVSERTSDHLIRQDLVAEQAAISEIELAEAVDDTVYVDEASYKKYKAAERHWSRKTKTIATLTMTFLALTMIVLLILLVTIGTSMAGPEFLALLLWFWGLLLIFLLVLLIMLLMTTSETQLEKLEKERIRKEKRNQELEDLQPEERERIMGEDEEDIRRKKKGTATFIFIMGMALAALIVLTSLI